MDLLPSVRVKTDTFEIDPPDNVEGVVMVKLKRKQIGVGPTFRIPGEAVPDKW